MSLDVTYPLTQQKFFSILDEWVVACEEIGQSENELVRKIKEAVQIIKELGPMLNFSPDSVLSAIHDSNELAKLQIPKDIPDELVHSDTYTYVLFLYLKIKPTLHRLTTDQPLNFKSFSSVLFRMMMNYCTSGEAKTDSIEIAAVLPYMAMGMKERAPQSTTSSDEQDKSGFNKANFELAYRWWLKEDIDSSEHGELQQSLHALSQLLDYGRRLEDLKPFLQIAIQLYGVSQGISDNLYQKILSISGMSPDELENLRETLDQTES